MVDLYKITKNFILNEGTTTSKIDVNSYLHALSEIIYRMSPKTLREKRDIDIAKQHLKEIKREVRRLNEQINTLQEQLSENKEK